jgi:DNA-binding MarR family transcriptional regulator
VSRSREELLDDVLMAGRELSTAAVMFHTAVGEASGLSVTEAKALEVITRSGPVTPADIARLSGLAPASVTALLDRLERKRAARRIPHPTDGRRFLIEIDPDHMARSREIFTDLVQQMRELSEEFDDDELETVVRFMRSAARRQVGATERLTRAR